MDMGPAVMAPSALRAEEQRRQDDLEREKLLADQEGRQHASAPSDSNQLTLTPTQELPDISLHGNQVLPGMNVIFPKDWGADLVKNAGGDREQARLWGAHNVMDAMLPDEQRPEPGLNGWDKQAARSPFPPAAPRTPVGMPAKMTMPAAPASFGGNPAVEATPAAPSRSIADNLNDSAARSNDPDFQAALNEQAKALGYERYRTLGADGKVKSEFRPIAPAGASAAMAVPPGAAAGPATAAGLPPMLPTSPVALGRTVALPRGGTATSGPATPGAPAGIFDENGKLVASPGYAQQPESAPQVQAAQIMAKHRIDHGDGSVTTMEVPVHPTQLPAIMRPKEENVTNGTDATNGGQQPAAAAAPWSPFAKAGGATGAFAMPKAANPGEQFARNLTAASPLSAAGRMFAQPLAAVDRQRKQAAGEAADQAEQQRQGQLYADAAAGKPVQPQQEGDLKIIAQGQQAANASRRLDQGAQRLAHAIEFDGKKFDNLQELQQWKQQQHGAEFALKLSQEERKAGITEVHKQLIEQKVAQGQNQGNMVTLDDGHVFRVNSRGDWQMISKPTVTDRTAKTELMKDDKGNVTGKKTTTTIGRTSNGAQVAGGGAQTVPPHIAAMTLEQAQRLVGIHASLPAAQQKQMDTDPRLIQARKILAAK